jgi:hypothetical protein
MMEKPRPLPRYAYDADFLQPGESASLLSRLTELHGYILETAKCALLPTQSTVQFRPLQA